MKPQNMPRRNKDCLRAAPAVLSFATFTFIALSLAAFAFIAPSFAAKAKPAAAGAPFAARKDALLSGINARIDNLQKKQGCIKAAEDKAAMRACFTHHAKKAPAEKPPAQQGGGR
ncbi:MAG: hypothetical protein KGL10_05855 [Alphaproteobacteria bacterium]|nr:hypothetical protein [Alphaproteobacteria bacterium]MDE2336818.1 hypothetical protein [Alphaproteobacteria bacterium]